jgi:ubiquinone/menaquinone biosynthesis C-methylase UbiE
MAEAKKYRSRMQKKKRAQLYADRFETGSRAGINRREQRAVKRIFADLPDCRSVVDVPSGAGRFAKNLSRDGLRVIAIDVAFEILEHGKERAEKNNVPVTFLQGDATKIPIRSGAVDCVFCNRLLHHILAETERAVLLKEFQRVTKRYLVISFFDYRSFGVVRRFLKALKGRKPSYAQQPTFEQFTQEVLAAGFKVRAVVPIGAPWVAQKYFVLEKA